ncbi:MAG: ATP-binding protein, partial [Cyanobacteriota bacterium]
GIILTGPSGTGKTLIAKSIASMEGFNFLPLKLSDLKQLYVGHSGAEVKKIFDQARALEPTIIFIDEMDSVFPKRTDTATDSFAKDITNEFIAQVDGVDTGKQRIFIIGATNIPEVIDSAVISRFEVQTVPLPSKNEREKLFELYIPELEQLNWFRLNKYTFLEKTEGLSGRDIKEICNTIKNKINETSVKNINKDIFDYSLEIFKEKVISSNKDKFEYISSKKNFYNFNSIIGYEEIKKEIKNSIISVIKESELRLYNIEPERGILLEGSPGNGKSFISQCISGEFHFDFIKVLSKDIASKFYSEDSKKLSDIFESAFKISKLSKNGCVLFFDEFDGIASKNANLNLRATMLDMIVKSREIPNLILIAATNYKELLDEATIRDGRFDKKITVNNPNREDLLNLIKSFLVEFDKISNKNKIENFIKNETYEKILKYFDKKNDISKSISGIKVFANNLKKYAFFEKKINKDKILIIDDEIVLNYLASFDL